jgi:RimJ/RimL family protein N-acetyltransferase
MPEIRKYSVEMQSDIENFFIKCFFDLGWEYEPFGEHSDIKQINDVYMVNGCFWCMYCDNKLIGTIAVRELDTESKNAEMKRLYLLKEFQGYGYGNLLFETALKFVKENNFIKVYADTSKDRSVSQHILSKNGFNKVPKYVNSSQYTELFFELEITR